MVTPTALNAADYGMVPNTGTDQTANFQSAINAAQSQGLPLFIPGGTYDITAVNVTSDVEIYGSRRSAIILGFGQSPQINVAPVAPSTYINVVKIADIAIDGAGQTFAGSPSDAGLIQATDVNNLFIERCSLDNSSNHGLFVLRSAGHITGCSIGASYGFGIFSLDSKFLIQGNSVVSSGNGGIYVWRSTHGSDGTHIIGNLIGQTGAALGGTGEFGNAVVAFLADYVIVANNEIYNSTFSAIRFNGASYGQIIGNTCYGSGECAIWMEGGTYEGGIISNNVVNQGGGGINVANYPGHRVIVSNNQISNMVAQTVIPGYTVEGRGITAESDVLIVGNLLENINEWAIAMIPFADGGVKSICQAENNMIRNCGGGIAFQNQDDTVIMIGGNTIYNYTTTSKFAAIVAASYDGAGNVSKLPGATDLGNTTSSGFANVKLFLNYSFT